MKSHNPEEGFLKLLIYGQPGAGKTRLAATAAWEENRLGRALMLEAFGNPISIRDYEQKPDIITVEAMEDFNAPYDWILRGQPENHPFCTAFGLHPPYGTIIVDGLTEVQRFVIRKISGTDRTDPGNLTPALSRQGFGQLLGTMLNWAVHYIELPMNVILTSLEASRTDSNQNVYHQPLIWGQSGNEIAGYTFMVARVTPGLAAPKTLMADKSDPLTDRTENVAFFHETRAFYAKNQYCKGPDHMTDPTIGKILDLIDRSS